MHANTNALERQQLSTGIDPAEVAEQKRKLLEEIAIEFETAAVEELTHARQWAYAASDPRKLARVIHDLQSYQPLGSTDIAMDTSERRRAYEDTLTERRAALWTRSFLRQYYPDSLKYRGEMQTYQRQTEQRDLTGESGNT